MEYDYQGEFWFKKATEPNSFKTLIDSFKQKIWHHTANKFDYIACQGVSGAILAGPLSLTLNKPLLSKRMKRNAIERQKLRVILIVSKKITVILSWMI